MSTIAIETVKIDRLDTDNPQGVERRLTAALRSVAERGAVDWNQSKLVEAVKENIFDCCLVDNYATFGVAIASRYGMWNRTKRAYWFEGTVHVTLDGFSVLEIWAADARITVVGRSGANATRFIGHGADYALAQAYRQVVLRDLGLAAATGWETGQRDQLEYEDWATVLEIPEPTAAAEPEPVNTDDEPLAAWEEELYKPLA